MADRRTMAEIVGITGLSERTIRRYIKSGNLQADICRQGKRTFITIKNTELERFFKENNIHILNSGGQFQADTPAFKTDIPEVQADSGGQADNDYKNIKEIVKEAIQEQQSAIIKPIEEQALYIAGILTKENQYLNEKIETLRMENEQLRDQLKILPLHVEEVNEKIKQIEQELNEEKSIRERTEHDYSQLKDRVNTLPVTLEEIPVKLSQLQEEKEKTVTALNEEKTTRSKIETEVSQLKNKISILPAPPEVVVKTLEENKDAIVKAEAKSQELELQAEEQSSLFKQEKRGLKDKIENIKKEKEKHLKINIVTAIVIVLLLIVSAVIIPKLSNLNSTISKTTDQLHTIQATKSAIEATKEQKEKLLNKTNEAWKLYSSKKYDEAIKIYDDILQTDPNNAIAWDNRGQALYELKKYDQAIICFDKLLQINPDAIQSLYLKGQALYNLKKYKEAVTCFDNYLKVDPGQVNAWNYKGKALDKMGQYSEAIKCYNKTLSIDPNNAEAITLLNSIR
jgi:tetratricopeptide (TPR) repeat protein